MKIAFWAIGVFLLIIVVIVVYRLFRFKQESREASIKRFLRIQELYDKLNAGHLPEEFEIKNYAKNVLTREMTFQLLKEHGQTSLFPNEYLSIEKSAESNLANWLEFPTELNSCPDEIEHLDRVTFGEDGKEWHYHVFKFRVYEPHWAARKGWMLGVTGPYYSNSFPYDFSKATYSRLKKMDSITPFDEARWVHANISMKNNR